MPRYFFNSNNGMYAIDSEGTELPDIAAARVEASMYLGEILRLGPNAVWTNGMFSVDVTDEHATLLFSLLTIASEAAN